MQVDQIKYAAIKTKYPPTDFYLYGLDRGWISIYNQDAYQEKRLESGIVVEIEDLHYEEENLSRVVIHAAEPLSIIFMIGHAYGISPFKLNL